MRGPRPRMRRTWRAMHRAWPLSEAYRTASGHDRIDAIDQGRREIEFGARVHDTELQPEDAGRSLRPRMQARKPTSIRWSKLSGLRDGGRR
jgi:hypothetical protein